MEPLDGLPAGADVILPVDLLDRLYDADAGAADITDPALKSASTG